MWCLWSSWAAAVEIPGADVVTVHGWTDDGALVLEYDRFVRKNTVHEGAVRWVAVVGPAGVRAEWPLTANLEPVDAVSAPSADVAGWGVWRAAHRVRPAEWGLSQGDARLIAVARGEGEDTAPECAFGACSWWPDAPAGAAPAVDLSVESSGFTRSLGSRPVVRRGVNGVASVQATVVWDDAHQWLAVLDEGKRRYLDVEADQVSVGIVPWGPRVSVWVPPGSAPAAGRVLADALAAESWVHLALDPAPRAASVVYVRPGWEAFGAAWAGRVPGGATVERLGEDAPQDVVFALSTSAL